MSPIPRSRLASRAAAVAAGMATLQRCSAKPKGSICLFVELADTAFWLCTAAVFETMYPYKPTSWLVGLHGQPLLETPVTDCCSCLLCACLAWTTRWSLSLLAVHLIACCVESRKYLTVDFLSLSRNLVWGDGLTWQEWMAERPAASPNLIGESWIKADWM